MSAKGRFEIKGVAGNMLAYLKADKSHEPKWAKPLLIIIVVAMLVVGAIWGPTSTVAALIAGMAAVGFGRRRGGSSKYRILTSNDELVGDLQWPTINRLTGRRSGLLNHCFEAHDSQGALMMAVTLMKPQDDKHRRLCFFDQNGTEFARPYREGSLRDFRCMLRSPVDGTPVAEISSIQHQRSGWTVHVLSTVNQPYVVLLAALYIILTSKKAMRYWRKDDQPNQ